MIARNFSLLVAATFSPLYAYPQDASPADRLDTVAQAQVAVVMAGLTTVPEVSAHALAQPGPSWVDASVFPSSSELYMAEMAIPGAVTNCVPRGGCDFAEIRDAYDFLQGETEQKTIHLSIHVFCKNGGNQCNATQETVDTAVEWLNLDFAPWGFDFTYETEFVNNGTYRVMEEWTPGPEAAMMKELYADSPETKLNIYVVDAWSSGNFGTFPWSGNQLNFMGGMIMHKGWFGISRTSLTNLMGTNLGLWHTYHGVDEVQPCSDCYERAGRSISDGDESGDFCSDTEPTPTNGGNCFDPGGFDPCSNFTIPWGATPIHNYMGAAPQSCKYEFTPQQAARMHCWTTDALSSWIQQTPPPAAPVAAFSGSPLSGNVPLQVDFVDQSTGSPTAWTWDFGDGSAVSSAANPSHVYTVDGIYSVVLTVSNAAGSDDETKIDYVTASIGVATEHVASAQSTVDGTVIAGGLGATMTSNNGYESIQEVETSGNPNRRKSKLEHRWTFDLPGGASALSFYVEAYQSESTDGDNFRFDYDDGSGWQPMVTVSKTVDDHQAQVYVFPNPGAIGNTLQVRVIDTDRTNGHTGLDTIHVDRIHFVSQ